jgi:hypothetical protein
MRQSIQYQNQHARFDESSDEESLKRSLDTHLDPQNKRLKVESQGIRKV